METINPSQKNRQTTSPAASHPWGDLAKPNDIEAKRKVLYKEASKYLAEVHGCHDDLADYAEIYVDDSELDKFTGKSLAEMYLDTFIGEFDTSEEVIKYYQDECDALPGDSLQISRALELRGDILKIGSSWFWNL